VKVRLETSHGEWVERIPAWIKWATQVGSWDRWRRVAGCCSGGGREPEQTHAQDPKP
jgi:hypothetical protein